MTAPKLLLTPGEPAGIGPELCVQACHTFYAAPLIAIADPELLLSRAALIGKALDLHILDDIDSPCRSEQGVLNVLPVKLAADSTPGKLDIRNADYVLKTLTIAADLCIDKKADAVITGPVQKSVINDAGVPFSGHTEFFADRSNTPKVVMMLATEGLRVALATTHLPLKDVSDALTYESLHEVTRILVAELKEKFRIDKPRILVAGLNPHAGEGGHLGSEEIETIIPVLSSFDDEDVELIGPLPADTLFTPHYLKTADAVLAMYHDQGLPVLKHLGFGKSVNITLGLPFVRTSVDHGTALDLAGKGEANLGSLLEAIRIAHSLVKNNGQ